MPDEPRHGDALDKLRDQVLAGEVPTKDVADALERRASDPSSDVTVQRPASEPTVASPERPPDAAAQSGPVEPEGKPFGRYRLLGELGHGGMGVVWRAYDTQLRRVVALKGLIAGEFADRAQIERFMREARSAARLSHPGIVPVYDVGEHEGYHYFTTEYIEGSPLDARMKQPVAVRQSLDWVKAIAEALHCAHVQGVVHRDVKPGNVLIDAAGRPHVMDFGLAKQVEQGDTGPALTLSGDLLGTPRYMSPEQTRGAAGVGPASDQFSLGVVLYELLTGRPPFDGTSMRELLNAIAERDPASPTEVNPRIHRDIETICLKALEKDPARRYASLADMATDIGSYLAGEPIAARPVSGVSRLLRRAARHKAIVGLSAAGLVLGVVAIVYALSAEEAGKEKDAAKAAEAAARAQMAKAQAVSKVFGRWSLLHDTVRGMEGTFYDSSLSIEEKRSRSLEAWQEVQASLSASPSDVAAMATTKALAGWARRLAGFEEEGFALMREAATIDPDVPYGLLLEALVHFSEYAELQSLPDTLNSSAGTRIALPTGEGEDLARIRVRVESLLDRAEKAAVWGVEGAEPFRAAVLGMRAMQSDRYREAYDALTRALGAPDLRMFQSGLYFARAKVRFCLSDYFGGLQDLARVLDVRPRQARALDLSGDLKRSQAWRVGAEGGDPRPLLRDAIADGERAVALDPSLGQPLQHLALARLELGEAMHDRGEDPREEYRLALAVIERLVREGFQPAAMRQFRANVLKSWATAEAARGGDPLPLYEKALADEEAVVADHPTLALAHNNLAYTRLLVGQARGQRGLDPCPDLAQAVESFSRAVTLDPTLTVAWVNRAGTYVERGNAESARGADPRASYELGIADFGEAIGRQADYALAWHKRGDAHRLRGDAEAERGGDPGPWYGKAIADLDEALRRKPGDPQALNDRGIAHKCVGEAEHVAGRDPRPSLDRAIVDLRAALSANPGFPQALNNLGNACMGLARAEVAAGGAGRQALDEAIEAFGGALETNPEFFPAYHNRGLAHKARADGIHAGGGDACESYDRAIADFSAALARNPSLAVSHNERGLAGIGRGNAERRRGGDPAPFLDRAIEDFRKASALNPAWWEPLSNLGQLYEGLGEPAKAVDAYEAALRIAGDRAPRVREWLDRARAAEGGK